MEKIDETWRGRRNVLHTMYDSEVIRSYTLEHAGIMFVTDLIRDTLTSLRRNAIAPEMDVITTLTYLVTRKMQLSIRWFGSVPDSTFKTLLCRCSFNIKYVKYDSMVNKKIKNIYIYIYIYIYYLCVCVCVGMFMWFMRTQTCIMTWVWHRYYKEKVIYEDIFSVPII